MNDIGEKGHIYRPAYNTPCLMHEVSTTHEHR